MRPFKAAADSNDVCANLWPCPCQNTTTVPADGWKNGRGDGDKRKDGWIEERGRSDGWRWW